MKKGKGSSRILGDDTDVTTSTHGYAIILPARTEMRRTRKHSFVRLKGEIREPDRLLNREQRGENMLIWIDQSISRPGNGEEGKPKEWPYISKRKCKVQ